MKSGLNFSLCSFRRSAIFILLSSCIFISNHSECFGQEPLNRPKLGLVLSGGGACGIAHIGVLMVMDEEGLRPDYITGVSMGSLVGSLYSAGYSADSLVSICRNVDWDLIISNKIPENMIIYGEKDHFYNSIVTLPVTRTKVKLPSGLINGQQLENTLSYYYWPVAETESFSKLPIPFMCLAVDLITCSKVELRSGYLPDAIRASCAVPYIFTPLKVDSMLLVDGGVLRNFAAEEVRDMGADIVIGSYTGSRYRNENELQTISDVMIQLGFFSSINDYKQQKKLVDFLIEPYTDDISPASFESFDTLIMRGYKAAEPFRKIFRMIADSLHMKSGPAPLRPIEEEKSYQFERIVVNGNNIFSDDQILGVLGISPGDRVGRDMLSEKIDLLYGKAWFEKVKYRIVPDKGKLILEIDCIEKPRAIFYGSVHYDDALNASLLLGLTIRDPLIKNSQIDINSALGKSYRFSFNYIKFIGRNQNYNLSADIYTDNTLIPKMELAGETEDALNRNLWYGFSVNRRVGLNNLFSLSARFEDISFSRDLISGSGREKYRSVYFASELGYHINTLNTKYFPDKGIRADLSLTASRLLSAKHITDTTVLLYDNDDRQNNHAELFYTIRGTYDQYFSQNRKWTFRIGAEFLFITNTDSVSAMSNMYFIGGTESVSPRSLPAVGFHPLQFQATRMAGIHLDADYEITEKVHLTLMTGLTSVMESDDLGSLSLLPGVGLGAGYLSIIGPIKVGIMYGFYKNEEYFKRLKGYISVGYCF
jgi:NTE family protein